MERRKFIGYLGIVSGGIILPQSASASIKENSFTELLTILGHKLDVKPKKIILSLDENDHLLTPEEKILANKLVKNKFAKYDIHKDKFSDRKINMYNPHTGETINEVYWSDGKYIKSGLAKINYFMRDFREDKVKNISLRTINSIYTVSKHTKKNTPMVLTSAYRTKRSNKKVGGARRSQHIEAKAIDFSLDKKDNTSLYSLKRFLVANHNGGVGYYPGKRFIHIDSGSKRNWRG